jgi:hypothetical protein
MTAGASGRRRAPSPAAPSAGRHRAGSGPRRGHSSRRPEQPHRVVGRARRATPGDRSCTRPADGSADRPTAVRLENGFRAEDLALGRSWSPRARARRRATRQAMIVALLDGTARDSAGLTVKAAPAPPGTATPRRRRSHGDSARPDSARPDSAADPRRRPPPPTPAADPRPAPAPPPGTAAAPPTPRAVARRAVRPRGAEPQLRRPGRLPLPPHPDTDAVTYALDDFADMTFSCPARASGPAA